MYKNDAMKRKVFYSFHYAKDSWRASQVRNIGVVEGNAPLTSNKWEEVKQKGDANILKWIQDSLVGKTCLVVLIGEKTSERKWCNREIEEAWRAGKGIVGIYIHNLKDFLGNQSEKGKNPFKSFYIDKTYNYIAKRDNKVDNNEILLSLVCHAYDPPYTTSKNVYDFIADHIEDWVEEAITIRMLYPSGRD